MNPEEIPEEVVYDLMAEDLSEYPAYFPRRGYSICYELLPNNVKIDIFTFSGSCLASAGIENMEFECLYHLLKIRIATNISKYEISDSYSATGTLLTYYFEAVYDSLVELLRATGADDDQVDGITDQMFYERQGYLSCLN